MTITLPDHKTKRNKTSCLLQNTLDPKSYKTKYAINGLNASDTRKIDQWNSTIFNTSLFVLYCGLLSPSQNENCLFGLVELLRHEAHGDHPEVTQLARSLVNWWSLARSFAVATQKKHDNDNQPSRTANPQRRRQTLKSNTTTILDKSSTTPRQIPD